MENKEERVGAGRTATFEVETESIEEFFRFLQMRESQRVQGARLEVVEPVPRRAVFIDQLQDYDFGAVGGLPMVRRYVLAAFAYGEDLISHMVPTSRDIESPNFPTNPDKHPKRQQEAYDELRGGLEERPGSRGLEDHVPVLRGFMRHSSNPREAKL